MFIAFEGIEGSGKSTVLKSVAEHLENQGFSVVITREPGGSSLGRKLRPILLDARNTGLRNRAELFLFLADRAQHVSEVIRPALDAGQIVLCDRYADSTIAYQGAGRGMDPDRVIAVNDLAITGLWPDLIILLDLPAQAGLSRAGVRNRQEGIAISEGRFEFESLEFHERVRAGYLERAKDCPERFEIIDAMLPPDEVYLLVLGVIEKRLSSGGLLPPE